MKKSILKITAALTLALMMTFNITTSMNNTYFSLGGVEALASGTSGGGGCTYTCLVGVDPCSGDGCSYRWTCTAGCQCDFKSIKGEMTGTGSCEID